MSVREREKKEDRDEGEKGVRRGRMQVDSSHPEKRGMLLVNELLVKALAIYHALRSQLGSCM